MGVDTRISLPNFVRVRDVATVAGLLAGLPGAWDYRNGKKLAYRADTVEVVATVGLPECAEINLYGKMIDGDEHHYVLYHHEFSLPEGQGKGLLPRSTPFWIAVGVGLIEFFGGTISYTDSDDKIDKIVLEKHNLCPHTDASWFEFQERIEAVQPITLARTEEYRQVAAYK